MDFGEHNFGDLKFQVKEIINLIDSGKILDNLDNIKSIILLIENRLEICGHCNGETYNNGDCFEHFIQP